MFKEMMEDLREKGLVICIHTFSTYDNERFTTIYLNQENSDNRITFINNKSSREKSQMEILNELGSEYFERELNIKLKCFQRKI